jgi:ribosomal protein L37E
MLLIMLILYHHLTILKNFKIYYTINMDNEDDKKVKKEAKEPICPRCGLRSYDEVCQNCGTPIVDKKDEEEEEYDWREKHR